MTHSRLLALALPFMTVLLFCEGWGVIAFSGRIICNARTCARVTRTVALPIAEPSPMHPKFVVIVHNSVDCYVCPSRENLIPLSFSDWILNIFAGIPTLKGFLGYFARENQILIEVISPPSFTKIGGLIRVNDFDPEAQCHLSGDTFSDICGLDNNWHRSDWNRWGECSVHFYPCSFSSLEIVPKVTPLAISYNRISNGEEYSYNLKGGFPPVKGLVPGFLGLIGIAWGWLNLRFERRLPLSGIVLLLGCFLWGFACLILLPWLADQRF